MNVVKWMAAVLVYCASVAMVVAVLLCACVIGIAVEKREEAAVSGVLGAFGAVFGERWMRKATLEMLR